MAQSPTSIKAKEVMRKVIESCTEVKNVDFNISIVHTKNGIKEDAHIIQSKTENSRLPKFRIRSKKTFANGIITDFTYISDNYKFSSYNHDTKELKQLNKEINTNIVSIMGFSLTRYAYNSFFVENRPLLEKRLIKNLSLKIVDDFPQWDREKFIVISGTNVKKNRSVIVINKATYLPVFVKSGDQETNIKIRKINFKLEKDNYSIFQLLPPSEFANKHIGLIQGLRTNTVAPSWSLKDSKGKKYESKDFLGKIILIDFWGTWCAPCIEELPKIKSISKFFPKDQVQVIGISCFDEKGRFQKVLKSKGIEYLNLIEGEEVASKYNINLYPSVFIIGKTGKVLYSSAASDENPTKKQLISIIQRSL